MCVDLFRHYLWYSVSSSPNLLGPCDKQAELWSTLEAAIVATSCSLSSTCKFEWSKTKHRKLSSFVVPHSAPPPALLFISLPLCACPCVEGAHCIRLCCLSVFCCSLLYHASLPNLWQSLFTPQFAHNGQWRRHTAFHHLIVSILSCQLSGRVNPSLFVHEMLISGPGILFLVHDQIWKSTYIHH